MMNRDTLMGVVVVLCASAAIACDINENHKETPNTEKKYTSRSAAGEEQPAAPDKPTSQSTCGFEIDSPRHLLESGRVLLLGEMHGTQETPRFIAELACHTTITKTPVRIGLEIPRDIQPIFDRIESPKAIDDIMKHPHFKNRDGRASQGMIALLKRIAKLKNAGADVKVFAFDIVDKPIEQRDRIMGENVLKEVQKQKDALFIILTGNLHARTQQGVPWNREYKPMGLWIRQKLGKLVSLNAAYPSGTHWGVVPDATGKMTIGPQPIKSQKKYRGYAIELFENETGDGYHGHFTHPTVTASPPAI